jgi:hypothetical protein
VDEMFEEAARWSTASSSEVTGPLRSDTDVESVPLGEVVTLPEGHTAVARSVTPNFPPPDEFADPGPGRQLVEVDVEVCAGSTSLQVSPIDWVVVAEDNRVGDWAFHSGTLPSIEIAAGECAAGTVYLDIAADATIAYVTYGDLLLTELGRWEV